VGGTRARIAIVAAAISVAAAHLAALTAPTVSSASATLDFARAVSHGRFTGTVSLYGGTVTITPAPPSSTPRLRLGHVAPELWATEQLAGYQRQVVGYGVVTITIPSQVLPRVRRLRAWIALAVAPPTPSCADQKVVSRPEGVVVLGDAPTSPAAVVYATSVRGYFPSCVSLPPSTWLPTEVVSVPWRPDGPATAKGQAITVEVPACSTGWTNMVGQVGHRLSITYHAERYLRTTADCGPSPTRNVVRLNQGFHPTGYVHAPLGPVSQVRVITTWGTNGGVDHPASG
jgi:hypothetical protein